MLNKIAFKELGSEKILSAEVIDEDRIRFFMLNKGTEERLHVDATGEEAKLLLRLLRENLEGTEGTIPGSEALSSHKASMMPLGAWEEMSQEERYALGDLQYRMNRHWVTELTEFYSKHTDIKFTLDRHFQIEVKKR